MLANLEKFQVRFRMQAAVLNFISTHLISTDEQKDLRAHFNKIDKNKDGVISFQELVEGMDTMGCAYAYNEAERIFRLADIDGSGTIQYKEWAAIAMDKNLMLSKEKLRAAFDMIDVDGSGSITFNEIKHMLKVDGADQGDEVFRAMIKETD